MKKILIVEDEEAIRSFEAINLKRVGYTTVEAGSGEEALQIYDAEPDFDIALLDISMPGMDGLTLCKELRRRSSSLGIIMLTAFLCSFIHKLLYFIFSKYIWNNQDFWYVFFTKILLGAVLTAFAAILFYGITVLYNKIKIRKGRSRYYGF